MSLKFNPFIGNFDLVNPSASPGGIDGSVQYKSGSSLAGDNILKWNGVELSAQQSGYGTVIDTNGDVFGLNGLYLYDNAQGGQIVIQKGMNLTAANAPTSSGQNGGAISIKSGAGDGVGKRGNVTISDYNYLNGFIVGDEGGDFNTNLPTVWGGSTNGASFNTSVLTANRTYTFPDKTGTLATTSDANVVGPGSSTDKAIVRFSGTTGKVIQDYSSNAPTISDAGNMTVPAGIKTAFVQGTGAATTYPNSTTATNALIAMGNDGASSWVERFRVTAAGSAGVNATPSISDGQGLHVGGKIVRIDTSKTPATSGATGNAGEICWDSNYVYVCTATNTWKRAALSTW